ncbi:MAG: methyl-accepting chemotaxis protein [Sporomusaceae bacterium]|nr:methyl-accepting chemotaxis protein [Sporomusaceae bacterium]
MKLKAKIVTGLFLLITLPCLTLGILSYRQTADSLKVKSEEQTVSIAEKMGLVLEANMESADILAYTAAMDGVFRESVLSGNGEMARTTLQNLQQQNQELLDGIFIVDAKGTIIMSSQDGSAGYSVKERDYFKQAMAGQKVTSEVLVSKTNHKSIILITQPIKDNGKIVGVLAASVNFDYLVRQADSLKIGETGYAYLLNNKGQFVSHPNKDLILKESLLESKDQGTVELAKAMTAGKSGQGFYVDQGQAMLAAYVPVKQFSLAVTLPVKEYMKTADRILYNTVAILVIALALALAIAYIQANSLVKPIEHLRSLMRKVEQGDLTQGVTSTRKDEIGDLFRSFDAMLRGQAGIVKNVRSSSDHLFASSSQMAASIEQVVAAGNDITENTQDVAEDARVGNEDLQKTRQILAELAQLIGDAKIKVDTAVEKSHATSLAGEAGRRKVSETVSCMQDIKAETQSTGKAIEELNQYAQQAGQIIEMITALAKQTNLLALNASIEAARAGEHGKGFSVVAEEVRKLAEQSDSGARDISALIYKITENTSKVVEAIDKNAHQVAKGVLAAQSTDDSLAQIDQAVADTVLAIAEINQLADQELANSEEIVGQIEKVAAVMEKVVASSQQVAAAMEEQAAGMQTLAAGAEGNKEMAGNLQALTSRFDV